ncbi:MAG: OmpA family protein [Turneriella sp.]
MKSKRFHTITVLAGAAVFALMACSSTEEKKPEAVKPPEPPKVEAPKVEAPVVAARSVDPATKVDEANEKLTKVAVTGLPAFEPKGGKKMEEFARKSLEESKAVIADMPEGYVLQITGHHNQHPDKSKRKGNGLSVQRAKYVYDYFVKNGVPKEKLSYRGAGSAEYDKNLSRSENRRVTFKVVKADAPADDEKPKAKPKAKKEKAKKKKAVATDDEAKADAKPAEPKAESKPEVKNETKPAASAPEVKPAEPKVEAKPAAAPAVPAATEAKPEEKK